MLDEAAASALTARSRAYELIELPDGAVLLDPATGHWYELNDTAKLIWKRYLAGFSPEEIASDLQQRYGVTRETLERDVHNTLRPGGGSAPTLPSNPLEYRPVATGYELWHLGLPILLIAEDGGRVELLERGVTVDVLASYLLGIAPKIAALQGTLVLHASAVVVGDAALLFLGDSGAGKTTTARAVAAAGPSLIAEDKVVVSFDGAVPVACVEGEARLARWSREAAVELTETPHHTVAGPSDCTVGERARIAELWALDVVRRAPVPEVQRRELGVTTACARLIRSVFVASRLSSGWVDQFRALGRLLQPPTKTFEATVPDGLETLRMAAAELARPRGITG